MKKEERGVWREGREKRISKVIVIISLIQLFPFTKTKSKSDHYKPHFIAQLMDFVP